MKYVFLFLKNNEQKYHYYDVINNIPQKLHTIPGCEFFLDFKYFSSNLKEELYDPIDLIQFNFGIDLKEVYVLSLHGFFQIDNNFIGMLKKFENLKALVINSLENNFDLENLSKNLPHDIQYLKYSNLIENDTTNYKNVLKNLEKYDKLKNCTFYNSNVINNCDIINTDMSLEIYELPSSLILNHLENLKISKLTLHFNLQNEILYKFLYHLQFIKNITCKIIIDDFFTCDTICFPTKFNKINHNEFHQTVLNKNDSKIEFLIYYLIFVKKIKLCVYQFNKFNYYINRIYWNILNNQNIHKKIKESTHVLIM